MISVKCFDNVALPIIEEANQRFAPLLKPDAEKLDILKEYCEAIDVLAEEFDGESYEVEVDDISMQISVTLECAEVLVDKKPHRLYDLIERSVSYSFSYATDDTMFVKFVFPSIWDKA